MNDIVSTIHKTIDQLENVFSSLWYHIIPKYMAEHEENVELTNSKIQQYVEAHELPADHFIKYFDYEFAKEISNVGFIFGAKSKRCGRKHLKKTAHSTPSFADIELEKANDIFSKSLLGKAASGLHFCDFFPQSDRCTGVHATLVDNKSQNSEKLKLKSQKPIVSEELQKICDEIGQKTDLLEKLQETNSFICPLETKCDLHLTECVYFPNDDQDILTRLKFQVQNLILFKQRQNMVTTAMCDSIKKQKIICDNACNDDTEEAIKSLALKGNALSVIKNLLIDYIGELDEEIDLLHNISDSVSKI
jgi:hypothetical protein